MTSETQETLERETLSALVWAEASARAEAIAMLPAEAFTRGGHRLVYTAILRCVETEQSVDTITVLDELEGAGHTVEDVGGMNAYMDTVSGRLTFEAVQRLASRVAESWARTKLSRELESLRARVEDRGQPLDKITSDGVDALLASGAPQDSIVTVHDAMEDVLRLWSGGLPPGAETGWTALDRHYRVARGQWSLFTGIPGHGKSTLLDALMVNLARDLGWKFVIFSPENSPVARHVAKLASAYSLKRFTPERLTRPELDNATAWVHEHFRWIDPNNTTTLTAILARVRSVHATWGIDGFVIDPWNELDHVMQPGENETSYISRSLTQLRRCARKTNAHAWMVAHPTKLQKNADGTYPVPTPYDVSGGANWRNKADFSLTAYRENVADPTCLTQVHVQKVRFQEHGFPGMVELAYEPRHNTFYEPMDAVALGGAL